MPASFVNPLGMTFVLLPAGDFLLGKKGDPEAGEHEARMFRGFYLQTSEVTNGQWRRYRPSHHGAAGHDGDDQPVVGVSHADATAFAEWARTQDPRWQYRLPYETEWEYGARAGGACTGFAADNPWGVRKADAKAREWCHDWWAPFPEWVVTDPTGPNEGTERVLRGPDGRTRAHATPESAPADAGFRLMTITGYGGDDRGSIPVSFHTFDSGAAEGTNADRDGYQVRIVQVEDRLQSRQMNVKPLPWVVLSGTTSPRLDVKLIPGRYYAQAQVVRPDGQVERGLEMKFALLGKPVTVDLPIPRPGAMLIEPQ
jgi:hypothetical protein